MTIFLIDIYTYIISPYKSHSYVFVYIQCKLMRLVKILNNLVVTQAHRNYYCFFLSIVTWEFPFFT